MPLSFWTVARSVCYRLLKILSEITGISQRSREAGGISSTSVLVPSSFCRILAASGAAQQYRHFLKLSFDRSD
jgi:hypothetical protein